MGNSGIRAKISVSELKKLIEKMEAAENKEAYSDEAVFIFPNYNRLAPKEWAKIDVELLPAKLGAPKLEFKMRNIDEMAARLKETKEKEEPERLIPTANSEKLRREISKELKEKLVNPNDYDWSGWTSYGGDGKIEEKRLGVWFLPNKLSASAKKEIKALVKRKIKPFKA